MEESGRGVALVTGASRGIGRAIAVELARQGFKVALAARTLESGEEHEHGIETKVLPGSLRETEKEIWELVRGESRTMAVRMDLKDEQGCCRAIDRVLQKWGRIDVFVNNAIYKGPGNGNRVLELDLVDYREMMQCNVFTPLALIQKVLPPMLERRHGFIFHLTSSSVNMRPRIPVDEGGWDYGYSSSKSAIDKLIPLLAIEHKDSGVFFFGIEPGLVVTEIMRQTGMDENFAGGWGNIPPAVSGTVIAYLCTSKDERVAKMNGKNVYAPKLCEDLQLIKGYKENIPDAKKSKI